MNIVGTVDGAVAHVDTVEDSVLVAVERAANAIDYDDAVDVGGITDVVVRCSCRTLKPVAGRSLVGRSVVLVGVGTAVAQIDRIGHKVTVAVGAAKDGEILQPARLVPKVVVGRIVDGARFAFELPSVGKDSTSGVDRAVVKVIRHTVKVEVGAAMSRCEVMNRDITIGSVGTRATIEAIGHAIAIGIERLAGSGIVTRIGAARVADTTHGVVVDGHGGTDVVLVVPDAAGTLIENVGDAVLVCKDNNNERKKPLDC